MCVYIYIYCYYLDGFLSIVVFSCPSEEPRGGRGRTGSRGASRRPRARAAAPARDCVIYIYIYIYIYI